MAKKNWLIQFAEFCTWSCIFRLFVGKHICEFCLYSVPWHSVQLFDKYFPLLKCWEFPGKSNLRQSKVIWQSPCSYRAVIGQSWCSHDAVIYTVIMQSSCIMQSTGSHQDIRQLSGNYQAVIRQSSGSHQEVIKQSSSSHQAVIKQPAWIMELWKTKTKTLLAGNWMYKTKN